MSTTGSWPIFRPGAFASRLKLPMAGYRAYSNGSLTDVGLKGYYYSSTVDNPYSRYLFFSTNNAFMGSFARAYGSSVRCLKD
ncbi:MAG: hypothetical protein R6V52_03410 [Bacteroidales bacterium]